MGADVCRTSSRASRRPPDVISAVAILDPWWRRRKWRQPRLGARFSTPIEAEAQDGGPSASGRHLGWPHSRNRKLGMRSSKMAAGSGRAAILRLRLNGGRKTRPKSWLTSFPASPSWIQDGDGRNDINQDLGYFFRSLVRWRWKMAALPLPVAILDDLICRNRKWGHPRWRPEAEGPPFSTSTSMGIEKVPYTTRIRWKFYQGNVSKTHMSHWASNAVSVRLSQPQFARFWISNASADIRLRQNLFREWLVFVLPLPMSRMYYCAVPL